MFRFILTPFLALLFTTQINAQQWQEQNTNFPNTSTGVNYISAVDSLTAWATGYDGTDPGNPVLPYIRTTNGGQTWVARTIPQPNTSSGAIFGGISAPNATRAWAMVYDTGFADFYVMTTANGGTSWQRQNASAYDVAAGGFLNVIHAFDANNAVTVGDPVGGFYEIYTTSTAGSSWQRVASSNIPAPLTGEFGLIGSVASSGNSVWFGTNLGRVYRSTNRGLTWSVSSVISGAPAVQRIAFCDLLHGVVIDPTDLTRCYTTSDGGSSWTVRTVTNDPIFGGNLAGIPGTTGGFVSVGAATGVSGSSYTLDGGITWTEIDNGVQHFGVGFASLGQGWASGFSEAGGIGGIYKINLRQPTSVPLCTAGLGGGVCDIDEIRLVGTTLNTNTTLCNATFYSTYPATGSTTATVTAGQSYRLEVTTTDDNIISAWADWDQDGQLESTEWVQVATTTTPGVINSVQLPVPSGALNGLTYLRIRTRASGNTNGPASACTGFASGETRDYQITVAAPLPNNSDPAPYCAALHTGGCGTQHITSASIARTALSNSSACQNTVGGNAYFNYPASLTTANLTQGRTYDVSASTALSGSVGMWIDYNRNNTFEASEFERIYSSGTSGTISFQVPANATAGATRLRLRSRTGGLVNSGDACTTFPNGETEDYTITVLAAPANNPPSWDFARGNNAVVIQMAKATDGSTYLTGYFVQATATFGSTVLTNRGNRDAFLAKYSNLGAPLWAINMGGVNQDQGADLEVDNSGNVHVVGRFVGILRPGSIVLTSSAAQDGFHAVVSPSGSVISATLLGASGSTSNAGYTEIVRDPSGSFYLAGFLDGTISFGSSGFTSQNFDYFVQLKDAALSQQWFMPSAGLGDELINDLEVHPQGGFVIGGEFVGQAQIEDLNGNGPTYNSVGGVDSGDGFLARFSATGILTWARQFGTAANESVFQLAIDAGGSIYAGGSFQQSMDFGGAVSSNLSGYTGGLNAFLVKLDGNGTALWSKAIASGQQDGVNDIKIETDGDVAVALYLGTDAEVAGYFPTIPVAPAAGVLNLTAAGVPNYFVAPTSNVWSTSYTILPETNRGLLVAGLFQQSIGFGSAGTLTTTNAQAGFFARLGTPCALAAPVATSSAARVCAGASFTLSATGVAAGSTYLWSSPGGFSSTSASPTVVTTAASGGAYQLIITNSGCSGTSNVVNVAVDTVAAPTANGASRCGNGSIALTATGAPTGGSYRWYAGPTGGSPLFTGAAYSPTLTGSATYYVSATSSANCESRRIPVVATVNPTITASVTASGSTTLCQGDQITLTVDVLPVGTSFTTTWSNGNSGPSITVGTSGTYSANVTSAANCLASSPGITVTVNPRPTAVFSYAFSGYCRNGASPVANVSGTAGGVFTAQPAGLAINAVTGAVNLRGSTPGSYQVRYRVAQGGCADSSFVGLNVSDSTSAGFAYSQVSYCNDAQLSAIPSPRGGGVFGAFTSNPPTAALNATSGSFAVQGALPGTYVITNTVSGTGACPGATSRDTLIINLAPTIQVTASGPLSFCQGDSVRLTATTTGSASVVWSFGATTPTITVRNTSTINATATGQGGCQISSAPLQVTVTPVPPQPGITQTPQGGAILLSSSATVGNQWYRNGVPVPGATGQTYLVGDTSQNGLYTVVASQGTCASPASVAVQVTVTIIAVHTRLAPGGWQALPTPVKAGNRLSIRVPSQAGTVGYRLFSADGRLIAENNLPSPDAAGLSTLPTGGLSKGLYHLVLKGNNQVVNLPVLVSE